MCSRTAQQPYQNSRAASPPPNPAPQLAPGEANRRWSVADLTKIEALFMAGVSGRVDSQQHAPHPVVPMEQTVAATVPSGAEEEEAAVNEEPYRSPS